MPCCPLAWDSVIIMTALYDWSAAMHTKRTAYQEKNAMVFLKLCVMLLYLGYYAMNYEKSELNLSKFSSSLIFRPTQFSISTAHSSMSDQWISVVERLCLGEVLAVKAARTRSPTSNLAFKPSVVNICCNGHFLCYNSVAELFCIIIIIQ